jgi:hypothetical protein
MTITSSRHPVRRIAAAIFTIFLLLFAASAGRMLVVNAPQRSDVILVLAGETDHRPALAMQLLEQGYARRVILDVPAGAEVYGFSEVDLAGKYAQNLPHAGAITICPIVGLSTKDESHDAETCLNREGGKRVLIVTSDFHTRRALSVFRHEVPSHAFTVAGSTDDTQFGERWWQHRQWAKTCVEEWTKTIWWNAVDRWR